MSGLNHLTNKRQEFKPVIYSFPLSTFALLPKVCECIAQNLLSTKGLAAYSSARIFGDDVNVCPLYAIPYAEEVGHSGCCIEDNNMLSLANLKDWTDHDSVSETDEMGKY